MSRSSLLSLLLLSLSILRMGAQKSLDFEFLTPEVGLSHRHVTDIIQDSTGFIWIGTKDGLNKFDGIQWTVYKHDDRDSNSIYNNSVYWIYEDPKSNLLIGTENGTELYSPISNAFRRASYGNIDNENAIICSKPIKSSNGNLYTISWSLVNEEMNLLEYQEDGKFKNRGKLTKGKALDDFSAMYPLWSVDSILWFADRNAYYKIDIQEPSIEILPFEKFGSQVYNSFGSMIPVDRKNYFHLPSRIESDQVEKIKIGLINHKGILSYFYDNFQQLWIQDKNKSLYKYDQNSKTFIPLGKINDLITPRKLFRDRQNNCWIPNEFGVIKIKAKKAQFENHLKQPLFESGKKEGVFSPYTLLEDQEGNIVFIDGYQIYHLILPEKNNELKANEVVEPGPVLKQWTIKLVQDEEGILWYPQKDQLCRYDPKKGTLSKFDAPGELASLAFDDFGKLWLIENPGGRCFIFDPESEVFEILQIPDFPHLTNTIKRSGDFLWISTQNGLLRISAKDRSFKHFQLLQNRNYYREWIYDIAFHEKDLWLATFEGLWQYKTDSDSLFKFNTANGLPHDIVYTVIFYDGYLYLGTHKGLCRFDLGNHSIRNYFELDGLSHDEFNRSSALLSRSNKMYFGGLNGINSFYPKDLDSKQIREASKLVWTSFSLWDRSKKKKEVLAYHAINNTSDLKLSYRDNGFNFSFALLNYTFSDQNIYHYTLTGPNTHWTMSTKDANINYNHLRPGKYLLKVSAQDVFGLSSKNEISIPFKIKGPWYITWYTLVLIALIIILIGLGIRRYEMRIQQNRIEANKLKEVVEVKERLYSNITHEFRTPLTVIQGLIQEIKGYDQEKQIIKRNTQTLLTLVNQLLSLSKVETGMYTLNLKKQDLIAYVKYLCESFDQLAKSKGLNFVVYAELEKLYVDFDEEAIQHIVNNLISNAIKYTDEGGQVLVHLHTLSEKNKNELELKVIDNGRGIEARDFDHIFERYYQGSRESKDSPGTGIGLALTKELVQLMEGSISVKSKMGKGSEFIVRIPFKGEVQAMDSDTSVENKNQNHEKVDSAESMEHSSMLANKHSNAQEQNGKALVLIVEDNKDVIYYLESILKNNYRILSAFDGRSGLELAKEYIPDIIISDVMMPQMDGIELCSGIKTDLSTSHIPVILLTAKTENKDKLQGLASGADAYLQKPLNKEELLLRLEKLIDLRKTMQEHYLRSPLERSKSTSNKEELFLEKLNALIEKKLLDSNLNIELIARNMGLSRSQLFRKLKAITNLSASAYIRNYRLEKARVLLEEGEMNVSEVAFEVGFNDLSYFSTKFKEKYHSPPSEYKAQ